MPWKNFCSVCNFIVYQFNEEAPDIPMLLFHFTGNFSEFPVKWKHFVQTMRSYARGTKAAFCKTFNVRVRVNALLFLNSKKSARSDALSSQSELRLPLLQVVSSNKYFSVGVQSPTEINAPRGRTLSGRQCAPTGTECRVQWFWKEDVSLRWPESRTKSHVRSTWI